MLPIFNTFRLLRVTSYPIRVFSGCIPNPLIQARFNPRLNHPRSLLTESQGQKTPRIYHIERNTSLSLFPVLRNTSKSSHDAFFSFWKLGGVFLAGYVIKHENDLFESVYAEEDARKDRLASVDTLKSNGLANPAQFGELETHGDVYELVSEKNLALRHYIIDPSRDLNDLKELKTHLPAMNVSVDLKDKIDGLNEESYKKVPFSRAELKNLRAELHRLGLNELNKKLGNPFRASFQNGQLVWRSVHVIDAEDVRVVVDFETCHGRRVHINTGTHGDEQGNTVVDKKYLAEAKFSQEDLMTAWFKDNVSAHIVSSYGPPIYPPHIDRIDAWCFSEKTDYSDQASAQEAKNKFINSLLQLVGARIEKDGPTYAVKIEHKGHNQVAKKNKGAVYQAGGDINIGDVPGKKKASL